MLLVAAMAFATTNFPSALEADLSMPCQAACTVCHTTNSGGSGTVTQPFGVAMVDRGLVPDDTTSLSDALARLETDGVDSDGDGTPDVDALRQGIDPNTGTDFCGAVLPRYGCFGSGATAAVLLLPGLLVSGLVRRC